MSPLHLLQIAVALLCLAVGVLTVAGSARMGGTGLRRRRSRWPSGGVVALGGLLMLVGIKLPFLTFFGAALVVVLLTTLSAVAAVRRRPGFGRLLAAPFVLLIAASVLIGVKEPLGLKIVLLPRPDSLPYQPVADARVVHTYDPGMWFEGVTALADGTLYLSESKGEDYNSGSKSKVHAEVIKRSPQGTEQVFFRPPTGSTAGVTAVAADGTVFLTVTGGGRGLWRIGPDGQGRRLASLPSGSFPNGVTLGPDGAPYVADSNFGTIWRIDPTTGAVTTAYKGQVLRARRFVALPPGANGIHFFGGQMYVTNSDRGTLVRFDVETDGTLKDPKIIMRGVPADDFAIATDGTIYLTTHIYNTIVRRDADGRRTVIGNGKQHIVGATACALTTTGSGTTLYVVTDGGALRTGDSGARGTLVALTL